MKKAMFALLVSTLCAPAAIAATAGDVTAPIRQFIDAFNSGDTKAEYAACAKGDIVIIDEFAPHLWVGVHAPQQWAADYDKHAQATGVTEGRVTYGLPTRKEIEGDKAYVIVPTVYLYKERGKALTEEGQLTLTLRVEAGAWKITGWTWTGVTPHAAK
ncbi:MAG TPA: hypothetical protein VMR02_18200 [Terracidiphilus sp.]|jgi:hypothetical protein|nr:hypothetical protein [Terracidiphilus sp.]